MGKISNTVLTSKDQGLTGGQQKNARDNIGAMGRLSTWTDGDVVVSGENGEVVDSGVKLSAKADKSYVDTNLSNKADKSEVNSALAAKADKSTVEAELSNKADKAELNSKAEKSYVDDALANKVDKVSGQGLSTNDYTDADKQKLAGIGNFPAESGGVQDTLVTTGDKYTWNSKQDRIEYYLADATVIGDNSVLVITKSDGTVLTFSGGGGGGGGSSTFDTITADGILLIPENRNINIPLAVSTTAGQEGSAGLVKGIYEEFQS